MAAVGVNVGIEYFYGYETLVQIARRWLMRGTWDLAADLVFRCHLPMNMDLFAFLQYLHFGCQIEFRQQAGGLMRRLRGFQAQLDSGS